MSISNTITMLSLSEIIVDREARQRSKIPADHVQALGRSIASVGLISPIVVEKESKRLCAGECRLEAFKWLGDNSGLACMFTAYSDWTKIPVRWITNAPHYDMAQIELEENAHRRDLDWRDYIKAVGKYHESRQQQSGDKWRPEATGIALHISRERIFQLLSVYRSLSEPLIWESKSIEGALNVLKRTEDRRVAALMAQIDPNAQVTQTKPSLPAALAPTSSELSIAMPATVEVQKATASEKSDIIQGDFNEWAKTYSGPAFNLLVCDFPYGIGFGDAGGKQTNTKSRSEAYADDFSVYERLLTTVCDLPPSVLARSAHMLFWFPMIHYEYTMRTLTAAGWTVNPYPLMWLKSDNAGTLPDSSRGPRRIYETALLCTKGDRNIVRAVSNAYACPTANSEHMSCKPQSMLRHFLSMLVDKYTRMLDPTCGSGTSVRACESLGADYALGIELQADMAMQSLGRLRSEQRKRALIGDLVADKPAC